MKKHQLTIIALALCSVFGGELKAQESIKKQCITENLIAVDLLDKKFINAIKKIKVSPEKLNSNKGMVLVKGGVFSMGGDMPYNASEMEKTALPQADEFPKHEVQISDFYMDEHEVTVGEFLEFVQQTGYKTVAEYDLDWNELKKQLPPNTPKISDEDLKAGSLVFQYPDEGTPKDDLGNWWVFQKGVSWKNPDGKNIDIQKIKNLPVTHISWYDALAYAQWVGKRLPTEAEFEYAMRGGKKNAMYPWGNEPVNEGNKKGNFLQGEFPYVNTAADGHEYASPVKSFAPNDYGLYDIAGNLWEWTSDWYGENYYRELKNEGKVAVNPKGPKNGNALYGNPYKNKVVRGGSYFCSDGWCSGYRNSRRMHLTPDSSAQHIGFRLVRDVK